MLFIRSRRQTLTETKPPKESLEESSRDKPTGIFSLKLISSKSNSLKGLIKQRIYPKARFVKDLIKERIYPKAISVNNSLRQNISPGLTRLKALIKRDHSAGFKEFSAKKSDTSSSSDVPFLEWTDHSASLNQGKHWSSTIIALCSTMFVGSLIWAFTARIDQTITVRGRLQPSGAVREVESPSAGVVSTVYIKDGDVVSTGEPLFVVEAKGLTSRRSGLSNTLAILDIQARSLKTIINGNGDPSQMESMPELPVIDDLELSAKLITARQQSQLILSQLAQIAYRLESRKQTLNLQKEIADNLKPLYEAGAIARNQYLSRLNQVQEVRAEVQGLQEERMRVLGQAAAQLNQLNTQMINLRSELVGLKETLDYRTVKAPIDGKIFDAKVSRYSVVNGGSSVLKIVPDNRLEASINISNKDIGFVRAGMQVNVAVDSFPSGEFGYLEGTLTSIGSDALPPSSISPEYSFPATVILKQQEVESGGKSLNLQSGMGVNANIKLRSRPVISLITDMFTKQLEGVSRFR